MAEKLRAARQERAMEGQRRVVTMLFCDVQGSTEAASRVDPEEWAGIINGAFECMIPPVYRYEGTVARLMGDGILAFFGAPLAHEDDPQRAVLASLEILERFTSYNDRVKAQWGLEIAARVGINTGLVVVGAVGSDLQMEYTALGDAINLAARMEQTAAPGTVQISDETHRHIASLFEFEELGLIQIKGRAEPVRTYRPLRARADDRHWRGIEGLYAPMIGREKEIAAIQAALDNLGQHGVGALVFVTGEAGIGKSRLIHEVHGLKSADRLTFHEVVPFSFEASRPYAFFRSFLLKVINIGDMESEAEVRVKLAGLAERLPVEVRGGVLGTFTSILGVSGPADEQPADGQTFKRQLFATAREAVRTLFAETPGVIILDDLHWADPASLEILSHLFPLVDSTPILYLCATRLERDAPVWQVKTALAEEYPHRFIDIPIQPLSADNSSALVDHLLAVADLTPYLRGLILEKSEGNPYFLEEIVRALIEDGVLVHEKEAGGGARWRVAGEVDTLDVPGTLQSLLAARLDRLQDDTRQVLQMASVIGQTFYYRVLENITEALQDLNGSLATLQRVNMVVETNRFPELEFAFRHALLRETAYRSILRKQRREFHRRVGEAMEALFASRLDEYAPVLAMHFDRAEDEAKAYGYFLRAGDVAYRLHAVKEAISHYGRGLEIARGSGLKSEEPMPASLSHLCLRLGRAYELDGQYDAALDHYSELESFAHSRGDRRLELAAIAAHATIHSAPTGKFDPEQAEALSRKALALAEELADHETEAKIYWNLMMASGFSGESRKGYDYGLRSLEIARRHDLKEQLAYTLNDFQRASLMTGEVAKAQVLIEEAQQLWLELGNKAMYTDSLVSAALIYLMQGDYQRAEAACQEALQISQEIGNLWGQSYSHYTLGYLYSNQGKFTLALEVMDDALRLVEPSGFAVPLVDSNAYIGLVYGYLGDFERGKTFALEALRHARERLPAMRVGPLAVLAILDYWQGNYAAMDGWLDDSEPVPEISSFTGFERFIAECYWLVARGEYEKLLSLSVTLLPRIRPMGDIVYLADILRLNGEALLALDRQGEARVFLEEALANSAHAPHRKIDVHAALSRLETAQGNGEAAQAHLAVARQNVEIILQNVADPQLQASYLARPQIKAILEGVPGMGEPA